MAFIFHHISVYIKSITLGMLFKLFGTLSELLIPYILEHLLDHIVPLGEWNKILLWGCFMIITAVISRYLNVAANLQAVDNAHRVSYDIRKHLFEKTMHLSRTQFDKYGLPSITSRMTSDSYNVQGFVQSFQTQCVRAPIMLIGGIFLTMTMDHVLSVILCIMLPILFLIIIGISYIGIPLYAKVQHRLDDVVRVMRENIAGVRVIKALSKTDYEINRFNRYSKLMKQDDIKASTFMAIPGPFMQLCLNIGLVMVIILGANRVDQGLMKPGIILAFLTYFNMITQGVMVLNRVFMMLSKANASANRIQDIIQTDTTQTVYIRTTEEDSSITDSYIRFDHVSFIYDDVQGTASDTFIQQQCLTDISFDIKKGESLGIIGATGSGKSTILNLLMRFHDPMAGAIYFDGKDIRSYSINELRKQFGVVFQNDFILHDTLLRNICFGRDISDDRLYQAIEDSMSKEFINEVDSGLKYVAGIKGSNLSGGQKQRLLIARALAANPNILVLDDSSSALDYKTDAALRKAIFKHYTDTTMIMIAQRISSIQNMTNILVMDDGKCIGYGTHQYLLKHCKTYKEIYAAQMGAV